MPQFNTKILLAGTALSVIAAALMGFGFAKMTSASPQVGAPTERAAEAPRTLTLTTNAIQAAGVALETVEGGDLSSEVLAQGTVVSSLSGQAVLTARTGGTVLQIFKRLGDPVRAGETLALVSSNEAAQIAADRRAASARARLAQQTLTREKSLFDQGITPRADYEQASAEAEAARAEAARTSVAASNAGVTPDGRGTAVVSPISGRITAAAASLGAFVQPETELFRVSDPSKTEVQMSISARDAGRILPGDRAALDPGDGRTVAGTVRSITPTLDAQTRTATAVIDAPSAGLIPGHSVRVRLRLSGTGGNTAAIVVPEEAVQSVEGRDVVFIRTAEGFKPQPVVTGQRSAGRIEIISGLARGTTIATKNAFLLKAEISKSAEEE